MYKVKGSIDDAHNSLTIGQYDSARKELFAALGLSLESRTAFGMYLNGTRPLKYDQIIACQKVFAKYGIEWIIAPKPTHTVKSKVADATA